MAAALVHEQNAAGKVIHRSVTDMKLATGIDNNVANTKLDLYWHALDPFQRGGYAHIALPKTPRIKRSVDDALIVVG